ncbi:hypothetical protein [Orientia tsutsugamushi]
MNLDIVKKLKINNETYSFFSLVQAAKKFNIRLLSKLDNDVEWCYKNLI